MDAKSIPPCEMVSIKYSQNNIVRSKNGFLPNLRPTAHDVLGTEHLLINNQLQNNT